MADETSEPTPGFLKQQIAQNHESARSDHKRLREELTSLERRVSARETADVATALKLQNVEATLSRPMELSNLRFTPSMVVAIVAICGSIAGAGWVVNSNVDQLATEMRTQTKIQDERMQALKSVVDTVQRQQTMQDMKIQNLRETLLEKGKIRSQP